MNIKVTVSIEDNERTVATVSGEAEYFGVSVDKVFINSSSLGRTDEGKKKARDTVREIASLALVKMT